MEVTTHDAVATAAAAETKETYVWRAKLAQEANRFDDMARYMKLAAESGSPMSKDEDNMLAVAFKRVLDLKRLSRRTLASAERKDGLTPWEAEVAAIYRAQVDAEQRSLCAEMLSVVGVLLVKQVKPDTEPATGVFYWKLCGDYNRYAAEATDDPDALAAAVAKSRAAYEQADQLGRTALQPIDPIRLGLMLNYSVFLYQMCQQRKQGHDLAKRAFDDAVAEIDVIDDQTHDDSTLILRLIRDNLIIWIQENGGESFDAVDNAHKNVRENDDDDDGGERTAVHPSAVVDVDATNFSENSSVRFSVGTQLPVDDENRSLTVASQPSNDASHPTDELRGSDHHVNLWHFSSKIN